MDIGLSDDAFAILLVLMMGVAMVVFLFTFFHLKNKGDERIKSRKFVYTLALAYSLLFMLPVVWLSKMNLKWKAIASFLMVLVSLGRALGVDRLSDTLREALGKDREGKDK